MAPWLRRELLETNLYCTLSPTKDIVAKNAPKTDSFWVLCSRLFLKEPHDHTTQLLRTSPYKLHFTKWT